MKSVIIPGKQSPFKIFQLFDKIRYQVLVILYLVLFRLSPKINQMLFCVAAQSSFRRNVT